MSVCWCLLGGHLLPHHREDGGVLASQSSGVWATVQEGFEGEGWQNPGKPEQQHWGEEATWPRGLCFGLLDLLESLIFREV